MLMTVESLDKNRDIPIAFTEYMYWGEALFSNGEIIYYTGEFSSIIQLSPSSISKSKNNTFHTGNDEDEYLSIPGDRFDVIEHNDLRTAIAKSIMRHYGKRMQFDEFDSNGNVMPKPCSYVKSNEFKNFINSQQYKDYQLMLANPDFEKNGIESAAFKKYEQTYMSPDSGATLDGKPENIVTNSNLDTMTASASPSNGSTSGSLSDVGEVRPINYI